MRVMSRNHYAVQHPHQTTQALQSTQQPSISSIYRPKAANRTFKSQINSYLGWRRLLPSKNFKAEGIDDETNMVSSSSVTGSVCIGRCADSRLLRIWNRRQQHQHGPDNHHKQFHNSWFSEHRTTWLSRYNSGQHRWTNYNGQSDRFQH